MNPLNIARYGVLSHYPQANRTEHANIGLVVFLPDGQVRVHFGQDLKKLRAMDPQSDVEKVRSWETGLPSLLRGMTAEVATQFLAKFGQWSLSQSLGTFSYRTEDEYLRRAANALHSLVAPPATTRRERPDVSRLHLDLKSAFASKGWLGKNIENHEIVERYPLGPMTSAEFALKNGRLHVIESLDLRTTNPSSKRSDARSKALTLDMAKRIDDNSARYTVLAGIDSPLIRDARELMRGYSEHVFTWEHPGEMNELMSRLGTATGKPGMALPLPQ